MAKAPSKTAAAAQSMQTVRALVPVQYDQMSIAPGYTFDVRAEDLDQLVEVNAVALETALVSSLPAA